MRDINVEPFERVTTQRPHVFTVTYDALVRGLFSFNPALTEAWLNRDRKGALSCRPPQ